MSIAAEIKIEESLRGSEDFGGKAMGVQQILEASQQAPVVIDDGYSLLLRHEYLGSASMRARARIGRKFLVIRRHYRKFRSR